MQERPLRDDEYDEDDTPRYRTNEASDPVSEAVGSTAFVENHRIPECHQQFGGGIHREPERFDRYYFGATPPLLLDILPDLTAEDLERASAAKHVAFKMDWCRKNDRRYLAVPESAVENMNELRALLAGETETDAQPTAKPARPRKPASTPRGQISRPKATA